MNQDPLRRDNQTRVSYQGICSKPNQLTRRRHQGRAMNREGNAPRVTPKCSATWHANHLLLSQANKTKLVTCNKYPHVTVLAIKNRQNVLGGQRWSPSYVQLHVQGGSNSMSHIKNSSCWKQAKASQNCPQASDGLKCLLKNIL